jgi:hypothetical protein
MKNFVISIIVLIGSLHSTSVVSQITQNVNSENVDTSESIHEFINHEYHRDEFLPHTLVINYTKEQVEWYEPLTDWMGGAPSYKVSFTKVVLNDIPMVLFSVPEKDWNEGNYGQLCWVLPIYNPEVIYQINTSFIADSDVLSMEQKYDATKINDEKLKEWLKGIDFKKEPFKSVAGIETVSENGKYFIVEFKLKRDEEN